ncbi:MAG TPA: hypothetical protein VGR19_06755 [Allosphingosinicella sp.]|nr:hypothetical protein [Allosphingosinicella sp.]
MEAPVAELPLRAFARAEPMGGVAPAAASAEGQTSAQRPRAVVYSPPPTTWARSGDAILLAGAESLVGSFAMLPQSAAPSAFELEEPPVRLGLPPAMAAAQAQSRWSASAWMFTRRGGTAGLAPGGVLGGSQAGARIAYRIGGDEARPVALSFRGYAPLGRMSGAEAAAGLDWKPVERLPVHVLVERRQALGGEGRSAFAATAYGGLSEVAAGPFRIDAYGQAGVVGANSRDLFADGSAKVSIPVGDVKLGAGAWGAVQPGVSRLDVGPQASVRLPGKITVSADWRLKVAGDAKPSSGPTLTLSTDF